MTPTPPPPSELRAATTAFAGLTGLMVGSFLNVVVYRVPRGLSVVHPRSFCPVCQTPIRAADNVPVLSYVLRRGRCRHCQAPIAPRYVVVELATAALCAVAAWICGPTWSTVGVCALLATAFAVGVVATGGQNPPVRLAVVGTALGAALLLAAGLAEADWAQLLGLGLGLVVGAGLALGAAKSAGAEDDGGVCTSARGRLRRASSAVLPAVTLLGWTATPALVVGALGVLLLIAADRLRRARSRTRRRSARHPSARA